MARDPELFVFEEQRSGDVMITLSDLTDKIPAIQEITNVEWDGLFREWVLAHLRTNTSLGFMRLKSQHLTYNGMWSRT
jgi:hypothetical protein